jgi:hydroxymethylpyrimidine pyrophosphatase-like HAD family hydrolase
LAADFDGTLADEGRVGSAVIDSLLALRSAGVQIFLVTGRELNDLRVIFDRLDLFDAVVAENGAVLFFPSTGDIRVMGPPPPPALVELLQAGGVTPLFVGRSVVSTRATQETAVQVAICELGLNWRLVKNGTSLMCLPSGVDKASGLRAVLGDFRLDARKVVAIGDGENDLVLFAACGFAVAVANACNDLKGEADLVTEAPDGAGVVEFIRSWRATRATGAARSGTKSRFGD